MPGRGGGRVEQSTPEQQRELRERLRSRAKVERKLSELMRRHGLRQGRYLGQAKTELQAVLTATLLNPKRLLTLAAAKSGDQGGTVASTGK